MLTEACPSILKTISGLTFRERCSVAQAGRRSWKRTLRPESPARSRRRGPLAVDRLYPSWLICCSAMSICTAGPILRIVRDLMDDR